MRRPCVHTRRLSLQWLLCGLWVPAMALEAPKQKVVLSLTGKVTQHNAGGQVDFDMGQLAALPQHSFTTRTPWDKDARKFSGPLLRDVLVAAGAHGETLQAIALNDYKVSIPVADARQYDVIIASAVDGQAMRVRDRGPLFIVYPYDTDAQLRRDMYFARSAWQLRRIHVQ